MQWWEALTPPDYVMMGLLLIAFLQGWYRGLLAEVLRTGALIITLVVAGRYGPWMRELLNNQWQMEEHLRTFLAARIHLDPAELLGQAETVSHPQALHLMSGIPLPQAYKDTLAQRLAGEVAQTLDTMIVQHLSEGLASAIAYLVLAGIVGLLLGIVVRLLTPLFKSDFLLGTANRLAGGLARGLEAAVLISLVVALVAPTLSLAGLPWLEMQLEGAVLTQPFLNLFTWLKAVLFGQGSEQFFII